MRKIQINVEINLFDGEDPKKVLIYVDANNPYEAASAAFKEMLSVFQETGHPLPSFGVSEHHSPLQRETRD